MKRAIPFSSFGGYRRWCWPWWRDLFRCVCGDLLWWDIKCFWHRARYGWSYKDVICGFGNPYLDGVFAGMLPEFVEHNNGVPGSFCPHGDDCDANAEAWTQMMLRWAAVFDAAARDDYYEIHGSNYAAWSQDEQSRLAARDEVLKEVIQWWECLWD